MKLKNRFLIIFLLFIASIPLVDLLHPGIPVTHDGPDHVARIANFYQSFSEGNIVPRWAANLNWGFGHPILMFLYPLPSYIASFFHFIGFSFVDSTKLVFAVAYIASVLAMFAWAQAQWGTVSGIVAGLLYGFAPYRFVDLYVRGAIGEHVAFVFPPLILYGIFMLAKKGIFGKWGIFTSLSMAGLILSHNAVSLMFLPVIILYVAYLYVFETKQKRLFIIFSIVSILFGFILSAFFWIPALLEGKYTLRDIVMKGDFKNRFVPLSWFFYSPWNYGIGAEFSKSLGFFQWIAVVGGIITFLKSKDKKIRWTIVLNALILVGSIFLMTSWSVVLWQKISLLQKFQFPWRLLTLSVFAASVLGAIVVSTIPKRFSLFTIIISFLFVFGTTYSMWHSKTYSIKPQEYYTGIYDSTTDTGESSPIWSTRFMEKRAASSMEIVDGSATIVPLLKKSTRHEYTIVAQTKTRLVENTLYFPGWSVQSDGKLVPIEFQDPGYRGLMTFWIEQGRHSIVVTFTDTRLRMLANIFSFVGLGLLFISAIIPVWKKTK